MSIVLDKTATLPDTCSMTKTFVTISKTLHASAHVRAFDVKYPPTKLTASGTKLYRVFNNDGNVVYVTIPED